MNRVLIVSYYCYPESTPRGFRCFEFVNEYTRRGYNVDLILPKKNKFANLLSEFRNPDKITISFLGETEYPAFTGAQKENKGKGILDSFKGGLMNLYKFFFPETHYLVKFSNQIFSALKLNVTVYESIVSIGLPFHVHKGVAKAIEINPSLQKAVKFADYGDPFSTASNKPLERFVETEKKVLTYFDYLIVPNIRSIHAFLPLVEENKIKVVNHCMNFDNLKISNRAFDLEDRGRIIFAYTGILYKEMRNPKVLMEFIKTHIRQDFIFVICTISSNVESVQVVEEIKNILGDKVRVYYDLDRYDVITVLKKSDFLLNIISGTDHLLTSKLVDYVASDRPIFEYKINENNSVDILSFFEQDYTKRLKLNNDQYDIKYEFDKIVGLKK
ncbi:hypothetical protein [Pedobacter psychrodurus]|uniref:hypothetical protein n=1 Tax=Pedobacter psychrodurus TaxID=2530456 RepID=UPI0029307C63|nr:hypothetical protein [Pedobacter psychrodurus]